MKRISFLVTPLAAALALELTSRVDTATAEPLDEPVLVLHGL